MVEDLRITETFTGGDEGSLGSLTLQCFAGGFGGLRNHRMFFGEHFDII